MRRFLLLSALMLVSAIAWTLPSQETDAQATSLGNIARRLRAQRADAAKNPGKIFTNDDLSLRTATESLGTTSTPAHPAQVQPEVCPAVKSTPAEAHGEKYYREEKAKIDAALEIHNRELTVLQQKASQTGMQYYSDPNKTLQQEFTRSDINKLNDQIERKKQQIAADGKALDDLRDQLRREGGDPGWLR
jgi:hypothetical protein